MECVNTLCLGVLAINNDATRWFIGICNVSTIVFTKRHPERNRYLQYRWFWCYAKAFGSTVFFTREAPIFGLRQGPHLNSWNRPPPASGHIWGDGTCATDYCGDTPPLMQVIRVHLHPYHTATCSGKQTHLTGKCIWILWITPMITASICIHPIRPRVLVAAMSSSPIANFWVPIIYALLRRRRLLPRSTWPVLPANAVVTLSNMTSGTPLPSYTWSATGPVQFPLFQITVTHLPPVLPGGHLYSYARPITETNVFQYQSD